MIIRPGALSARSQNGDYEPPVLTDLAVTIEVDDATPNIGGEAVFTVSVENVSSENASDISISALLPSGYTYVSDDGGGSYDDETGVWTIAALAASATDTLEITADVEASGTYAMTASLTSCTPADGDPANDSDSVTPVPVVPAPSGLTYGTNPASYRSMELITPNSPSVTGSVTSYSVDPALPAGLTLNTSTGQITGAPESTTASAVYTVTATGPGGSTECELTIEITFNVLELTPLVWLRSDQGVYSDAGTTEITDGGAVQQWNDLSGNGNHLIQTTGAAKPTYTADGGSDYENLPIITMASGDFLQIAALTFGDHTIFTVGKHTSNGTYLWDHQDATSAAAGNYQYCYGDTSASYEDKRNLGGDPGDVGLNFAANWLNSSDIRTIVNRSDGSTRSNNLAVRINGSVDLHGSDVGINNAITGNPTYSSKFTLGAYYDGTFGGNHVFTELIVFNYYLSTAEVQQVEAYLKARYEHYV